MKAETSLRDIASPVDKDRDKKWGFWLEYANREDYGFLAASLLKEAAGTEMHEQMRSVATDWVDSLRLRHHAENAAKTISRYIGRLQPKFRFLFALDSMKRLLMFKLLSDENTSYVLSNNGATDICVVTHDPSTANIRKYSGLYSDILSFAVDYFGFMVYGDGEIDDSLYDIKITKEEWNAFTT